MNMEFSPPKPLPKQYKRSKCFTVKVPSSPDENVEEKPVLVLKPFCTAPHISFNKVKIGCTKIVDLFIENPLDVNQIVQVEKFPTDKGFFIESNEFFLEPKEEKTVQILWVPEKASNYRETIVFKSSTGCKTYAYLLGTAYSSLKRISQRNISSKSKSTHARKKCSPPKIIKTFTGEKNVFPENLKICEETKENFNFLNSKDMQFANKTECTNFKFPVLFEPGASFSLKIGEEFPDSPIRRQTYTINNMLLSGRESEILPFPPEKSFSNVKFENTWKEPSTKLTLNNSKHCYKNVYEKNMHHPLVSKISHEDNLDDSLENKEVKNKNSPVNLNDSLSDIEINNGMKANSFCANNVTDSLNSFAFPNTNSYFKHFKVSESSENVPSGAFANIYQPQFSKKGKSYDCNKSDCHDFKKPSSNNCENFNKVMQKEDFSIPEDSIVSIDLYEEICNPIDNSVPHSIKGKILKKTQGSLFMEIPNDTFASNDSHFSENIMKDSVFQVPTKCPVKAQKWSPLKAKLSKSGFVSTNKSITKNQSVISKPVASVGKKVKLSKFMPRNLSLNKPRVTESVIYQKNPFASKNIYYDERWIEKREAAFTSWLNFILTPSDFSSEDVKVDSAKLWIESIKETSSVPAPTKEELSLKAFTAARNLNALRKASFSLYHSEEIVSVIQRIEKEVDLKKICIRKDRAIQADLGIKKDILEMLLSYNTLWLRIGLETVYGEIIMLQNNSDVLGLSRFIIHRFLQNPELSSKYMHPAVINYYKKGYEDEMKRFTLKKFLLLVFFLDKAKSIHLIKHDPCLFNKNAKYKSSRDLLLLFSREYLSGEGDVTKHLRYLGYRVTYEQSALEEFDFSVRNLSTDLRCGLRLGRVVELLLQDWTIFQKLRINTLNRLTKIHNNDVILKALKNASIEIENNIEAKHITDGDREKTLDLLWQIIFKTQIMKLINKDFLKKEIAFLHRSLKLKADFAAYNALRKPDCTLDRQEKINIINSKLYKENEILQLLFEWCQTVCAHYDVKVHNFTSSFSDGRALCLLLHHYHPNILPYESIKIETSNSYFEKQMEFVDSNESCPFYTQREKCSSVIEMLLKNERDNLTLVFRKFQEIGHIPILSSPSDMSNTLPDEKVIITLVAYVNMRLMELSIEIRAARKILHAWNSYKLRKQHKKLEVEIQAVRTIQKAWKKFLEQKRMKKETKAAVIIQNYWRMYFAKKQLTMMKRLKKLEWLNKNATIIQASIRGFFVRKCILRRHKAAIIIQTYFRAWITKSHYIKLRNAVLTIQQNYRARVIGRRQRLQFITMQSRVIKLQAYTRGMLLRKHLKTQHLSATKIQAYIRMWLIKKRFNKIRNACITIQQKFKGYLLTEFYSQEYQNHRSAAIRIQRWYRSAKIQQQKIMCVIKIQAGMRKYIARKKYLNILKNVIKIQIWWRAISDGRKTRLLYIKTYKSILCMQSFIRKCIASRKYIRQKTSAIIIQKYFRAYIAKRRYHKIQESTILIQNIWRSKCLARKDRLEYLQCRKQVILIQSVIRRFIAVCRFRKKRWAAIHIQKSFRAFMLRKKFCHIKACTILIQRKWRAIVLGQKTRASFLMYRHYVIYIQSVIRKQIALHNFRKRKQSAILIQRYVRMFINRNRYLKLKNSVLWIENWWYNILCSRRDRNNFLMCRKAAVTIQSLCRMYFSKRNFNLMKKAVATIELYRIGKIERRKYLNIKQSTIKLQSIFRCYSSRKKYLNAKKSIVFIQACSKRFILKKKYIKIKAAAITIQSMYRMHSCKKKFILIKKAVSTVELYRIGKIQRKRYLSIKQSAVKIQSMFRCYATRKKYLNTQKSIVLIQSSFRRFVLRNKYLKMRAAVMKIQSMYRMYSCAKRFTMIKKAVATIERYRVGNFQKKKYLTMKQSAIRLQSLFRCYSSRKKYLKTVKNIVLIQSCARRFILREKYLRIKSAAIIIQSMYRMHSCKKHFIMKKKAVFVIELYRIGKLEREKFLNLKQSVIKIQSMFRCYACRKKYLNDQKSIVLIQACSRRLILRTKYMKTRAAVIKIQKYYQAYKLKCTDKKNYMLVRNGFIKLQAIYRGRCVRKNMEFLNNKAIVIQSAYRRWKAESNYKKLKQNCIIVQKRYRAKLEMKRQYHEFVHIKKAVIRIQASVRCYVAHKYYKSLKSSVIKIQSHIRMIKCYRRYNEMKKAAKVIQKYYRSVKHMKAIRNNYLYKRSLIILLQCRVKSVIVRKKFLMQKKACIAIQSYFRMYLQRKKYVAIHDATTFIQKYFRNWQIMKNHRNIYRQKRKAIIYLQSKVRSNIAKKQYLKQINACISIQAFIRMYLQRKRYRKMYKAVICLQKHYRAWKLMKIQQYSYFQKRHAVIVLQSKWRSVLARKKFMSLKNAAITIQSCVRMYICKKRFILKRSAISFIQEYYRNWRLMKLEQTSYYQKRKAIVLIQSKFRSVLAKRNFQMLRNACTVIQSYFRMHLQRNSYCKILKATIFLQRYYRNMHLTKQYRTSFIEKRNAAIFLQSKIRCVIARRNFIKQKNACIIIQSFIRMFIQRKKYVRIQKAALVIQDYFRSYKISSEVHKKYLSMHKTCITIQSYFRMYKCRKEFLSILSCVVFIQNKYRAKLEAQKTRLHFLKLKASCIKIQSYFRMILAMNKLSKYRTACVVIQTNYRRYIARKKFKDCLDNIHFNLCCIKIQAFWRGYALRKKLRLYMEATLKIQRTFRLWRQRKMCWNMTSLIQNQSNLPQALFQHLWYIYLRRSLIQFQKAARSYLFKRHKASITIQSYFRMWRVQKEFKKIKAVTKIQAYWRGYVVRRSITDKNVVIARKKIKSADSTESKKLKNRTARSLKLLFKDTSLQSMLSALQDLDVCTRLSPNCCERFVASSGLTVLIQLVSLCNRSLPHMELIKLTTNILLNLAKYEKTTNYVWEEEHSVDTILHLMKVFREKGVPIFTKCCSLLWIFCQDPDKAQAMKENVNLTEQIRSFHFLLTRKQSLEEKHRVAKAIASKAYNPDVLTKRQNMSILQRKSLQIDPDWLLGIHRRREFKDPIIALSWVMKCLDLQKKGNN